MAAILGKGFSICNSDKTESYKDKNMEKERQNVCLYPKIAWITEGEEFQRRLSSRVMINEEVEEEEEASYCMEKGMVMWNHKIRKDFPEFILMKYENPWSFLFTLEIEKIHVTSRKLGEVGNAVCRLGNLSIDLNETCTPFWSAEFVSPSQLQLDDSFKKKEANDGKAKKSEQYGMVKLDEKFSFCRRGSFKSWLLQCLSAFGKVIIACFSTSSYLLPLLVALLLVIPGSNGESCFQEAVVEVDNITFLSSCETCVSHKVNLQCHGGNISACLKIYGSSQFAVVCSPNICINDGCPELNGKNGSYKVQYRHEDCNSTCHGHFSLAEWNNSCQALPPPSVKNNCSSTRSEGGENGSNTGLIVGIVVPVIVVVAILVVVLLILRRKHRCLFGRKRTGGDEGEKLNIGETDVEKK